MEIHLVSSLTPDDERRLARNVLKAIGGVMDEFPVSYAVRIRTNIGSPLYLSREASRADDLDSTTA
jgi:hypothetical protein